MNRFKVLLLAVVGGGVLLAYALFLRSTSSSRRDAEPPASAPTPDSRFLEATRERPRPEEPPPPPPPPYPPPLRYQDLVPPPPPPPPERRDELEALERATSLTALRLDAPSAAEPPAPALPTRVPRRSLVAGTLIEAQLHQPLRTDQPATVVATSLRPVHDLYQRTILLPAGTRFLGTVAAAEVYDAGAELHWHRLITPDGRSLDLAKAESTDDDGGAVNGRRRLHRWQKTGAVLVTALTSAALEAVRGDRTEVDIGAAAGAEAATGTEALLSRWAQRTLARPPTIHLEAGTRLYIRVLSDLSL